MSYENVTIWFAKNTDGEIITINEINEDNKRNHFLCPVCGSDVIPRAIKSKHMTQHFAHLDKNKCNNETMIHWWYKNKFLEKGDKFTVIADTESSYVVKEILTEQEYKTGERTYIPDVTVMTECGKRIFFEMKYSNSKEVKDYIDIWLELKDIVVEIDIKQLIEQYNVRNFKALFYNGKCFNTKRNDTYYNTIGRYKEEKIANKIDKSIKERLQKLDWFWEDFLKYKKGIVDSAYLAEIIQHIDIEEKIIVYQIIQKVNCSDLLSLKNNLKEMIRKYKEIHRYSYAAMPKDDLIRQAIPKISEYFKNIDKDFKVNIRSHSVTRKAYRYTARAKIGYQKIIYRYYTVELQHKLNKYGCVASTDITTYVQEMKNPTSIFNYICEELNRNLKNREVSNF